MGAFASFNAWRSRRRRDPSGPAGSVPHRFLSLQARITLSVAVATTVMLAAFGYIATWAIRQSTATVLRDRQQVAEILAARIAESLSGYRLGLEDLAWQLSRTPPLQQAAMLHEAGEARRFSGLALLTPSGAVAWSHPASLGREVAGVAPMPLGASPDRPIVLAPAAGPAGARLLAFVVPIPAVDRVLVGAVNLAHAQSLNALRSRDGVPVDFELIDDRGMVLTSSDPTEIGRVTEHMAVLGGLIGGPRTGIMLHNVASHPHYVAYTPLPGYPGWAVNVEQPRDLVLSLPHGLQRRMALFGLLIVIGMSALAFLDVRSVIRPLSRLRDAAETIAGGNLDHPVQVDRSDEVGALAGTFETMRSALKTSREEIAAWNRELENRVADRTQKLTVMAAENARRIRQLTTLNEIAQGLSLIPLRTVEETAREVVQRVAAVMGRRCRLDLGTALRPLQVAAPAPGAPTACAQEDLRRAEAAEGSPELVSEPLILKGRRIGTFWLDPGPPELAGDDPTFRIIASQVAVAIENAGLYEEVQNRGALRRQLLQRIVVAQEEERHRIARELHDEIGQALTALVMQLGAAETALPPGASALREQLAGIRSLTSQTVGEVRRLMLDLRPAVLDDLGLVPAIRWYVDSRVPPAGIDATVSVSGLDEQQRLPRRVELVAFRLTQEAVTNVLRHAGAAHLTVTLARRGEMLEVSITDDGRGFDLEPRRRLGLRGGWGLVGMQERVSLLGGTLTVTSRDDRGTRVVATIPIGEDPDDDQSPDRR